MSDAFRPCVLIPTYNNPRTIRRVVEEVRALRLPVVLVDDGSAEEGAAVCQALTADLKVHLLRRENGGKGAAVKSGLKLAEDLGFTHALQVDADGQHNLEDANHFLQIAEENPKAAIFGAPQFDDSAPKGRLIGRKITIFWTTIETLGSCIQDPLCGYRVYPVRESLATKTRSNRMDFDPEIAVRLVWRGVPIYNIPTKVRYLSAEEGGISHFSMFWDNARISWMHTRLVFTMLLLLLTGRFTGGKRLK